MKSISTYVVAAFLTVSLAGCYHATIETGLTPSAQVIDIPWAASWVAGLVPPATVEAGQECPNGVAIVETQHSFLNQVVAGLTFGIFTPMHITVTCAAEGSMSSLDGEEIVIPAGSSTEEIKAAFESAADDAVDSEDQIYVRFE